jgi:hypothetical protein
VAIHDAVLVPLNNPIHYLVEAEPKSPHLHALVCHVRRTDHNRIFWDRVLMADLLWSPCIIRFYRQHGVMDDDMHFPDFGFEADQDCYDIVDRRYFDL